jgi:dephospho-CoA kinase
MKVNKMKKIVAIVGMSGAGKSLAANILEELGWKKIYFGGVIMDKLKEAKLDVTPENEKIMRESLRAEHGMGVVAQFLLPTILSSVENENTVLDGLYSWDELKILQHELKERLIVIAVISDRVIRYERISKRPARPFTREEALERDISEIEKLSKAGPIAMADFYIDNNSNDLTKYKTRLLEIIEMI